MADNIAVLLIFQLFPYYVTSSNHLSSFFLHVLIFRADVFEGLFRFSSILFLPGLHYLWHSHFYTRLIAVLPDEISQDIWCGYIVQDSQPYLKAQQIPKSSPSTTSSEISHQSFSVLQQASSSSLDTLTSWQYCVQYSELYWLTI